MGGNLPPSLLPTIPHLKTPRQTRIPKLLFRAILKMQLLALQKRDLVQFLRAPLPNGLVELGGERDLGGGGEMGEQGAENGGVLEGGVGPLRHVGQDRVAGVAGHDEGAGGAAPLFERRDWEGGDVLGWGA